jgi:tRNA threonylcarbamoyladenosine biosynthesis protein TsaE
MSRLAGPAPVWTKEFITTGAADTQALAAALARQLRAGDLLVLTGELGAGKTTFTQGLGEGLGVRPGIISPTFVLVRIHPNLPDGPNPGGPDLVHVDAYRLGSAAEIDDIDLENTLDTSVTVVEWGRDRVEHLSESRLEIDLLRATGAELAAGEPATGDAATGWPATAGSQGLETEPVELDFEETDDDESRTIRISAFGRRWAGLEWHWPN